METGERCWSKGRYWKIRFQGHPAPTNLILLLFWWCMFGFLLLTAGLTADFVWCRISIRHIQRWCELRLLWSWTQMQCLRNFFQHHTVLGLFLSSCPRFLNAPCRAAVQWGRAHQELVFNCAVFTSSLKQTSPQLWGSAGNGGGENLTF